MSGGATPPGWYPDPWFPGSVRWFDGNEWTEHAGPMGGGAAAFDRYDGEKGERTARWASWAFLARGLAQGVTLVVAPIAFARMWDGMSEALNDPESTTMPFGSVNVGLFSAVSQLASLVMYACLVFLCIWTFRATKNARLLGLRTTISPGWAVAGWLIPFANFVMPCIAILDVFPKDHPARRQVAIWWALEISSLVLGLVAYGFAFSGSTPAGVIGVVAGCCAIGAGVMGYRVTGAVRAAHVELARTLGLA